MYVGSVGLSRYSSLPVVPRGFAWAQAWQLSTWAAVLPSTEWQVWEEVGESPPPSLTQYNQ